MTSTTLPIQNGKPNGAPNGAPLERRDMSYYRAPSLFQPHRVREAIKDWRDGVIPAMTGAFLGVMSPAVALLVAPMGFDHVMIDWAHSQCNTETMTQMVHNIALASEGKSIPWVRIPGHEHHKIGYVLDAGASVMVPQVDTVEQARQVVSSAKFGMKQNGSRSAPPFRLLPGITDMPVDPSLTLHQNLNNQAAICLQIETLEGLHNLDAMLTEVPDIDLVWLATLDMRISMDLPGNGGMGGPEPEWQEAVALFKATLAKHPNVGWMGFALGDDETLLATAKDKAIVVTSGDVVALMSMAGDIVRAKSLLGNLKREKPVIENHVDEKQAVSIV